MRILYGVVGEGMGHATRSRVVLEHLAGRHQIEIVVSGRAHGFLRGAFPGLPVHEITGLNLAYRDNRVRKALTLRETLGKIRRVPANVRVLRRLAHELQPQVAIADFESLAHALAKARRIPVLSIDNMQVLDRCRHDLAVPRDLSGSFRLARALVRAKLPRCDHYVITSFFFPEVRKPRTTLVPPILRREILDARRTVRRGDHVLVYQTSDTFRALLPALQALPHRFVVYGLRRDEKLGNVELKGFSEEGFVRDLATCRAVLAGGGFSLMGEAVFLGKPMLAVPIEGQFEQSLNSLYLQHLGYGECHRRLDPAAVAAFLAREGEYARNLSSYAQDGNRRALDTVDSLLARLARGGRAALSERPH